MREVWGLIEANREGFNVFIETGTALGETTEWAATRFNEVYSIESQENNYVSSFQHLWDYGNVRVFYGDSAVRLRDVLWKVNEDAVIFLDAHFTNGEEDIAASSGNCPVLKELLIITQRPYNNLIFIDDARLFGVEDGWPTIDAIESFMRRKGYVLQIVGDTIVVSRNGIEV